VLTGGTVPGQYQQIDPGTAGQVPQVVSGVGAVMGSGSEASPHFHEPDQWLASIWVETSARMAQPSR